MTAIDKEGFPSGFQRDTILRMPSFQIRSFQEYTSAPVSGIVCDTLFGSPGKQKQVGICSHLFCDPLGVHKVLETLSELVSCWICKQNEPGAPRVFCHEWRFYKNYPIQRECHSYLNDPLYVPGLILGIESRAHTLAHPWRALYHRPFPLLCFVFLDRVSM